MLRVLLLTSAAGIAGTGLGGVASLLFSRGSGKWVGSLLGFSAGVMQSVVFLELLPEAIALSGLPLALVSVAAGGYCVWLMNAVLERALRPQARAFGSGMPAAPSGSRPLMRTGLTTLLAIGLHNLPEGLAIGTGGAHDARMGLMLAVLIALHDIPEGISVGLPLMEAGMTRGRALLLTAAAGVPTLLGGALGLLLGQGGGKVVAVSLGLAAGAMLYVTFGELMTQATRLDSSARPALSAMAGVLLGVVLVLLLH